MTPQLLMFTPTADAPKEMSATRTKQAKQWNNLRNSLLAVGVDVIVPNIMEQSAICADSGIVVNDCFIANGECLIAEWAQRFYDVHAIVCNDAFAFSGRDVLINGKNLFVGFGFETSLDGKFALDVLLEESDFMIRPLELVDPVFSTLDTCLCFLSGGQVLYYPAAFSEHSKYALEYLFEEQLVAVTDADAFALICNSICIGQSFFTSKISLPLRKKLEKLGYNILQHDMTEFLKFGASCKALTIFVE